MVCDSKFCLENFLIIFHLTRNLIFTGIFVKSFGEIEGYELWYISLLQFYAVVSIIGDFMALVGLKKVSVPT
jgi:hypothetical protein